MHYTRDEFEFLDGRGLRSLYSQSLTYFDYENFNEIPDYIYSSQYLFRFLLFAVRNFNEDSISIYFDATDKIEFHELYNYLVKFPKYETFENHKYSKKLIYNFVRTIKRDFLFLN